MNFFKSLFRKKPTAEQQTLLDFNQAVANSDHALAISLSKSIEINDDINLCEKIGFCYFNAGQYDMSTKYFKKMFSLTKGKETYWKDKINEHLAASYFKNEDYKECIKTIQYFNPEDLKDMNKYSDFQFSYMLGWSFQSLGMYKQAIDAYKTGKLSQQYPCNNQINMLNHTAQCYEAMGNKKQAINFYEKYTAQKFDEDAIAKIQELQ